MHADGGVSDEDPGGLTQDRDAPAGVVSGSRELGELAPPRRLRAHPCGHRRGVAQGPVGIGEHAPVAQTEPHVAPLLPADPASARLGHRRWCVRAPAGGAPVVLTQVPQLPAAGTGAHEGGAPSTAVTDVAAVPFAELHRRRAVQAGAVAAHSGGIERPRATFGSTVVLTGLATRATGVVSTSIRSLGVHSRAVQSAARVSSLTWLGCLVNSADTDAEDSSSPARSARRRRSCAPVQTLS